MAYKILFFGTSDFSIPSLKALINDARFEVKGVVTKPDSPIGRHQIITPPPVKKLAEKHGISVFQFNKIKTSETLQILQNIQAQYDIDAYVVVSYGKIIPQNILDLPKKGVINVHGSLLPFHRGASCVQAAIAEGDTKTGITIMLMDAEMDHGDILAQTETTIIPNETGGELHNRLAQLGADKLTNTLADYLENKITPQAQNHDQATYCKLLTRDDGKLNWNKSSSEIERLILAYNPWPGTWTTHKNKRFKILKAVVSKNIDCEKIDQSDWCVVNKKLFIKCVDNDLLEVLIIQPEGKKPMDIQTFLLGHDI